MKDSGFYNWLGIKVEVKFGSIFAGVGNKIKLGKIGEGGVIYSEKNIIVGHEDDLKQEKGAK